jgi:hypothetical protein
MPKAKASTARRLEAGDYDDPNVKRLFFGTEPQDEIDWIEELLSIDSETGKVVPFKLYPQQVQMSNNKTGRDITVKGRQTRASSYILAKNLRRMVTNWGLKCLVMTQDDQTTSTFRARIKHHLKDLEQHGFKFEIGLDNEDELEILDTDSRYIFGSGQEQTAGRAYTGHIVHLSEFAHWPLGTAGTLIGGITPSVPGPPAGWMDIESTPNGAEGQFYDMTMDSKTFNPTSRWSTHFYPWWLEPRYRAGTTPGIDLLYTEGEWEKLLKNFTPAVEEEKLMDEYDLDIGQVLWRRVRKSEQDKTSAPFLQEYVETLEGCFLTAGGNYFATPDGINHLEQYRQTVAPPKEIVENLPGSSVSFSGGGLHVWQRPQLGLPYAVWVDCAGGGLDESADYTAIIVMDCVNMFIAARLCVKVAPDEAAPMAVAIAQYYNNALLGGERDAFGLTCVNKIQDIGYKNLWFFLEPGQTMSISKPIEKPWGHPTQIRQHILSSLRSKVFNGLFHTSDSWGVQQMGAFTWQKVTEKRHGLKEAGKGQKDDIVMCYAGLCYIAPLASARYTGKRGQSAPGTPVQENEVVVVGKHGLVLDRKRPGQSGGGLPFMPWLDR